jgi:hypothetical protein
VSGREAGLDTTGADRLLDTGLPAFRTFERVAAFGFDLGLVMESSEVCATPSAAPPQPRPAKSQPAGQDPESGCSRPSHHSNALFGLECHSILSKIVAAGSRKTGVLPFGGLIPPAPASHFRFWRGFPRDAGMGRKLGVFAHSILSLDQWFADLEAEIGKSLRPSLRIFPFCRGYRQRPGSITPLPPDMVSRL